MSASYRAGRPEGSYLATLRKPTKADYQRLVSACIEALINDQKDVLVAFAYVLRFPKDFPRGILEEKVENKNIHRIKARKLYAWLYEHGHAEVSLADLREQRIKFGILLNSFDDLGLDIYQQADNNVDIESQELELAMSETLKGD